MTHSELTVHYVDPLEEDAEPYWEVTLGVMNSQYTSSTKKDALKHARKLAKGEFRPATVYVENMEGKTIEKTRYD